MGQSILLRSNPKIEFQLLENGFQVIDAQTETNNGYYSYSELESVELNNIWFPRLANWLRIITWILNGVPYFPDAETCKKSNLILLLSKNKLGIWLTDSSMARMAKSLKKKLDEKTVFKNVSPQRSLPNQQ